MEELMSREGLVMDLGDAERIPDATEATAVEEVIMDKPPILRHAVEGLPPTNIVRLGKRIHALGGFATHRA